MAIIKTNQPHNVDAGQAFSYTPAEFQEITARVDGDIPASDFEKGLMVQYMLEEGDNGELLEGADVDTIAAMVKQDGQKSYDPRARLTEVRHNNPYLALEGVPYSSQTVYWKPDASGAGVRTVPVVPVPDGVSIAVLSSLNEPVKASFATDSGYIDSTSLNGVIAGTLPSYDILGQAVILQPNNSRSFVLQNCMAISLYDFLLSDQVQVVHIEFYK